jgi:hypothetical protein
MGEELQEPTYLNFGCVGAVRIGQQSQDSPVLHARQVGQADEEILRQVRPAKEYLAGDGKQSGIELRSGAAGSLQEPKEASLHVGRCSHLSMQIVNRRTRICYWKNACMCVATSACRAGATWL